MHGFCGLLGRLRSPFSTNFCNLSILFRYFSACRFCIEFCMVLRWIFTSLLMTFSTTFSTNLRTRRFCKMYVFLRKTNDFQDSTVSFFNVFSMFFPSLFGIDFYMDFLRFWEPFWVHFASLFDPLASFGLTFSLSIS